METNWKNIDYLKAGNKTQQSAYSCLKRLKVFEELKQFNPVLTGTVPIEINIDTSDLDIICNFKNKNEFINKVENIYKKEEAFKIKIKEKSVLFSFICDEFRIEIRAEEKDVFKQNAYLHMISEYRLLKLANSEFKQKIIKLKQKGYKTEPAFGLLLNMKDPYKELLQLHSSKDNILIQLIDDYVEKQ